MTALLLTGRHLEYLCLKGGCTGSSESTQVNMPHCWKTHNTAHISIVQLQVEMFILCLFKCSLFILLEVYKMLPVERMLPHRNILRTIIPAV